MTIDVIPTGGRALSLGFKLFCVLAGILEIIAGLMWHFGRAPGLGSCSHGFWAMVVNLLTYRGYHDITLGDCGLSLGALRLARD